MGLIAFLLRASRGVVVLSVLAGLAGGVGGVGPDRADPARAERASRRAPTRWPGLGVRRALPRRGGDAGRRAGAMVRLGRGRSPSSACTSVGRILALPLRRFEALDPRRCSRC